MRKVDFPSAFLISTPHYVNILIFPTSIRFCLQTSPYSFGAQIFMKPARLFIEVYISAKWKSRRIRPKKSPLCYDMFPQLAHPDCSCLYICNYYKIHNFCSRSPSIQLDTEKLLFIVFLVSANI